MQPRSSLANRLLEEELAVGTVLSSVSPNVAEALGYTSLDFLFVDRQHGSPTTEGLETLVRSADLSDTPVIVRIPRNGTDMITYLFDFGVRGVMLPQVESAATVREASTHVRYEDGRSLGSTTRAAKFGNVPKGEYAEYVNDELALLPMIETVAGLEALDEIARLDAITAIAIGPGDLAWSLDVPFGSEAHQDAIDHVFDVAAENDCAVGIFVGSAEDIERYRDRAAFVVYGSDVGIVTSHFESVLGEE
ncbi:aldolase/citrate lyase family protein [Haladaptatus sp. DYF46]|uniref:HpcH/HpaI aldolase family protein n=1 Tax=Haladaptatus sp. DYF46 TaxID=2886041 RepID=UPI001E3A2EE1|nr:aldolase/citrate lyase family protein [Haladaptatus sp. DYF46]